MPEPLRNLCPKRRLKKTTLKCSPKPLRGNATGLHMVGLFRKAKDDFSGAHWSKSGVTDPAGSVVKMEENNHLRMSGCHSPNLQSKAKLPRKLRMRDQSGEIVSAKRKIESVHSVPSSLETVDWYSRVTLSIRCFRLGTLHRMIIRPTVISAEYIEIENEVRVQAAELTSCEWCTVQKLPTVFCQTTPAECLRLRLELGMSKVHRGHWYDCQSKNLSEQYFVLIFEKAPTATEEMALQEIFSKICRLNSLNNFPARLSYEEARRRLMSANDVLHQEQTPGTVKSFSSVPQCHNSIVNVSDSGEDVLIDLQTSINEPDRKLLVYPPSPARGGITVTAEDLSCLNKGEFLNDVIIDFYLRFLLCEKLQKEEAGRCHLFSSFFFRHLSQTVRKDNGVADLSLEERRHTRVKTWTRHVNLFQKDFIFIPINQCAHWYLAVICFPGLVVHYSEPHLGHQAAPSAHRGPVTEGHTSTIHSGSTEPQPSLSPPNPMSLFYNCTQDDPLSSWKESTDNGNESESRGYKLLVTFDGRTTHPNSSVLLYRGDLEKGVYCLSESEEDTNQERFEEMMDCESKVCKPVTHKRPCILIMDSLNCHAKPSVVRTLQEYLEVEWRVKMGTWQNFGKGVMEGWTPLVPQQDNFSDCGIYLLQYVESFLKKPPHKFHSKMDLSNWFPKRTVKKKREEIKELILGLHKQQQSESRG